MKSSVVDFPPTRSISIDGTARIGQDDLGPAVPLRERDANGSGALPDDRVRTAGEGAPLRRNARVLRSDRRSVPACSTRRSGQAWPNSLRSSAVLDRIVELIRERTPGMIVIDSFKALHPYARDAEDFRRFLHDLSGRLSAYPATSLWIGEYTWDDIGSAPEFAVVDAVVALTIERKAEREARVIQVLKLRGSAFRSGKHAYRLSSRGLEVFPRLADPVEEAGYDQEVERISSGVSLLDERLGVRSLAGRVDAGCRPVWIRQDAHRTAFRVRRGEVRPTGLDRVVPGEPNAARTDRSGIRMVAEGRGCSSHVPVHRGHVHRRMGLRTARRDRTTSHQASAHRQPRRPPCGGVGRGEIQGIHLLAVAADREVRREPVHDAGDRGALRRDQALGIRHLAPL